MLRRQLLFSMQPETMEGDRGREWVLQRGPGWKSWLGAAADSLLGQECLKTGRLGLGAPLPPPPWPGVPSFSEAFRGRWKERHLVGQAGGLADRRTQSQVRQEEGGSDPQPPLSNLSGLGSPPGRGASPAGAPSTAAGEVSHPPHPAGFVEAKRGEQRKEDSEVRDPRNGHRLAPGGPGVGTESPGGPRPASPSPWKAL